MTKKHRITYDSGKENSFIVHLETKPIKFLQSNNGLYYYKPDYKTKNTSLVNHSIESVQENKLLFTNRQVERAKQARNIYHALGTPSLQDFKSIITSNQIRNLPITLDDSKIAERFDAMGLRKQLVNLKPEQRSIIDLAYFNGYTQDEISKEMGIPLGTVKTRMRAAIIELRKMLEYN